MSFSKTVLFIVDMFISSAVIFALSIFSFLNYATFSFQYHFDHKNFIFLENVKQFFLKFSSVSCDKY